MSTVLKALALIPAAVVAFVAGCNPYAKGLEKANAEEQARNRTLTLAAFVMNGVKNWSAAHGGDYPNPEQFRNEVKPVQRPGNDWGIDDAELANAHRSFSWTFPGGRVDPTGAHDREVGRLEGPTGSVIAYANGEVRRNYERRN